MSANRFYDETLMLMKKADRYKIRWFERGRIRTRYFNPTYKDFQKTITLFKRLFRYSFSGHSLYIRTKRTETFTKKCRPNEDFIRMFEYLMDRFKWRAGGPEFKQGNLDRYKEADTLGLKGRGSTN